MCRSTLYLVAVLSVHAIGAVQIFPDGALSSDMPIESRVDRTRNSGRPILKPWTVYQLPDEVTPRSVAYSYKRRGLLIPDGAIHGKPYPFGYVIGADGIVIVTMEFRGRDVLPLGMAEDPADGRVGITFFQGPGVETWDPDFAVKHTFHDVSVKPALPLFDESGVLWVPYTLVDRQYEEGEGVIALWAYNKDGSRWEVFPRRQLKHVKYPHPLQRDAYGRLYTAGLLQWIYIDGVYGPERDEAKIRSLVHPLHVDVYSLVGRGTKEHHEEQKARWRELHPGEQAAARESEYEEIPVKYALRLEKTYPFPYVCLYPLLMLTHDGHALLACYDHDMLAIVRINTARGELVDELEMVREIRKPFGIDMIGGLAMDPGGEAFLILDKGRRRVYVAPWRLPDKIEEDNVGGAFKTVPVTGFKW